MGMISLEISNACAKVKDYLGDKNDMKHVIG